MADKKSLLERLVDAADDLYLLSQYDDEAKVARDLIYELDVEIAKFGRGLPLDELRGLPDGSLTAVEVNLLCDEIERIGDL